MARLQGKGAAALHDEVLRAFRNIEAKTTVFISCHRESSPIDTVADRWRDFVIRYHPVPLFTCPQTLCEVCFFIALSELHHLGIGKVVIHHEQTVLDIGAGLREKENLTRQREALP